MSWGLVSRPCETIKYFKRVQNKFQVEIVHVNGKCRNPFFPLESNKKWEPESWCHL